MAFCGSTAGISFALTGLDSDPDDTAAWRREVLPLCPRCHRALAKAAREGRKLRGTGERWYLGHGVGRFESRGVPTG
ncbi:MAG: hypothetical protein GTO22_25250 [Gemmatimonadales bacterium]|nr:hypothetical protein [Gemmatimonadales bacterium]